MRLFFRFILFFLLISVTPVYATSFHFSGTVTDALHGDDPAGVLPQVNTGDLFAGTLTIGNEQELISSGNNTSIYWLEVVYTMEVFGTGLQITSGEYVAMIFSDDDSDTIWWADYAPEAEGYSPEDAQWQFVDNGGSYYVEDKFLFAPSLFDSITFQIDIMGSAYSNGMMTPSLALYAQIDQMEMVIQPVPEPSTMALFFIGVLGTMAFFVWVTPVYAKKTCRHA